MNPSFVCRLVNSPFGDPGLYVEIKRERRALLFDLGELGLLSPSQLLKVSDVFISHTHVDHFIGFDHLLRILLGREKRIRLYGPPGLIANVGGKLAGYTWNLVDGYPLRIHVIELHPAHLEETVFHAASGFRREETDRRVTPYLGGGSIAEGPVMIHREPMLTFWAAQLNHRIPSIAFAVNELFHVNIQKDRLDELGLPVGPWLRDLKRYLWEGKPDEFRFIARLEPDRGSRRDSMPGLREFTLGEAKAQFVLVTAGQKIAYVVDAVFDALNERMITELARDADLFYCEAPFLAEHEDIARARFHLTAVQAGSMARKANVRNLVVFHFSPRYQDRPMAIPDEAMAAFRGTIGSPKHLAI